MKYPHFLSSFSALGSVFVLGLAAGSGPAFAQTWNAGDGSWNTATNWTPEGVPVSGNTTGLVFDASGDTSYTSTNNVGAGAFTLNFLTVNNTGTGTVTLAGAAAGNTYLFAGDVPTINVTAGQALFTGLMAGSATVTKTGNGTFIHDSNNTGFTGTLVVNEGTFINQSTALAATNFNPVSIVVNNGGTYQFGAAGVGNPNLPNSTYISLNTGGTVLWQEGEDFGGLRLLGGTLISTNGAMNLNGAAASELRSGIIRGPSGIGGTGAAGINKTTAGVVSVQGANISNTGPLNIQEGVLETDTGFTGAGVMTLGTAGNSATLQYSGGGTAVNARPLTVQAGGGTVLNHGTGLYQQSGAVTLAGTLTKQGAGAYTISGGTSGTGGVAVMGGTLTLTGPNTHTGNTVVNTLATLRVTPSATASASAIEVYREGTLAVDGGAGTGTFTLPSLSLGADGAAVAIELNTPTATATQLAVTNVDGLNLNGGGNLLRLRNFQDFTPGTITAISYQGADITSGITLDAGRHNATLNYNTAAKTIEIAVTGGTDTIRWNGALPNASINGEWKSGQAVDDAVGVMNWKRNSDSTATNFIRTDRVTFDDTAASFGVGVTQRVEPASVTFNNTTDYQVAGPGGIFGPGGLVKNGTGSVSLGTVNGYTGGTVVNAGTLLVADGASITGDVRLNGGTFGIGSQAALQNTSVVSLDGGTLRFTGDYASGGNQTLNFLAGGGTLEVDTGMLATKNGAAFTGAGALTKTGGGTLSIQVGGGAEFTGPVNINDGSFRFTSTRLTNADTMTVNNGGTLLVQDTTSYNDTTARFVTGTGKSFVLNGNGYEGGGAFRHVLDEAGSAIMGVDSPVTLATTSRITLDAGTAGTRTPTDTVTNIFRQPVSGPGGLIKDGGGTLILAAANDYTGGTVIEKGRLLVNGSTAAASGVTVNGGTLGGTGVVNGIVTVNTGGALAPGASIGALVTGAVTLNEGATMLYELSTAALDGDLVDARGGLTLNGNVSLTLADTGLSTAVAQGAKLSLVSYSGAWNGGTFSGFADDSVFSLGANQWLINYNDNAGGLNQGGGTGSAAVTLTAVPEPSVTLFGALAGAFALFFRRRK